MRQLLLVLPLLAVVACSRYQGPLEVFKKNKADGGADKGVTGGVGPDGRPVYSPAEQAVRARERTPIVPDDNLGPPKTYADGPGVFGR